MPLQLQNHHHQDHAGAAGELPVLPIVLSSPLLHFSNYNPLSSSSSLLVGKGILCLKAKRYLGDAARMSRRNGPKLDLKLNLSPPRGNRHAQSPSRSATVSPTSPPSSCVSSELNQDETLRYTNSPEATSMVLVGCPRCLMYVMLSEDDPKCPKCKSTVLLDFLHDNNNATTTSSTAAATTKKTRKG